MELKLVLLALCVGVVCGTNYKAAVADNTIEFNENNAVAMIQQAAQLNVDILMLPELISSSYTGIKMRQALSDAAKDAGIYVMAQMVNTAGETRTNLIFDRTGTVVSKPATSYRDTFTSDFGVAFELVNEEDLLMTDAEGARNVIAFGSPVSTGQFLYGVHSSGAWAYSARRNVITARAIYGGHAHKHGALVVAEVDSDQPHTFEGERHLVSDLSQVTFAPLCGSGRQRVCHEDFCCDFDIITKSRDLPYSLVSYSGVQDVPGPVRVETCALVACVGRQESCFDELERNKTNVFEKVTISAQFASNSKQYPVSSATYDDVTFIQRNSSASVEMVKKEVTSLGIFGISKDVESENVQVDDMSELFDYLWIRLRVAIFIVSIYVLEML